MDKEQRKSWRALMAAWNDDSVACHLHLARQYTQIYPEDMYGWIALADVLSSIASYDEAMQALRKARRLSPEDQLDFIYAQTGHFYKTKGDYKRAESWYRKAVTTKAIGRNLVFLGACLAKQGKYEKAKGYHRQAIEIGSEVADEAYFNMGLILRAEGKDDEALKCFEEALRLDPKYVLAKKARKDMLALRKLREDI